MTPMSSYEYSSNLWWRTKLKRTKIRHSEIFENYGPWDRDTSHVLETGSRNLAPISDAVFSSHRNFWHKKWTYGENDVVDE